MIGMSLIWFFCFHNNFPFCCYGFGFGSSKASVIGVNFPPVTQLEITRTCAVIRQRVFMRLTHYGHNSGARAVGGGDVRLLVHRNSHKSNTPDDLRSLSLDTATVALLRLSQICVKLKNRIRCEWQVDPVHLGVKAKAQNPLVSIVQRNTMSVRPTEWSAERMPSGPNQKEITR